MAYGSAFRKEQQTTALGFCIDHIYKYANKIYENNLYFTKTIMKIISKKKKNLNIFN